MKWLITLRMIKKKIKFPNRQATFLRNSPFVFQFDGDSFIDLEEEENKMNRERLKDDEIKKISSEYTDDSAGK